MVVEGTYPRMPLQDELLVGYLRETQITYTVVTIV